MTIVFQLLCQPHLINDQSQRVILRVKSFELNFMVWKEGIYHLMFVIVVGGAGGVSTAVSVDHSDVPAALAALTRNK